MQLQCRYLHNSPVCLLTPDGPCFAPPFFFGVHVHYRCTKAEANEAVLGVAPGGFIVRNSSKPGTHVLVVNDHGTLQNIQIHRSDRGFNLARGEPFATIDELIMSMTKGAAKPLLSKNAEHKGEHLYLRAGRVVTSEDAADAIGNAGYLTVEGDLDGSSA